MATHVVEPEREALHGHFSRDLPPILTIDSGDTVVFRTLDAGWGLIEQPDPFATPRKFELREKPRDSGHALCGPVAIRGATPGMVLQVNIKELRPARWGWSSAGGFPSPWNDRLGVADGSEFVLRWAVDPDAGTARNQFGQTIPIRPFMGILGMPPDQLGIHSTFPPRPSGGNIDCKELIAGTRVYLPIAVKGALFSAGDGHAAQGDGEVAGPALECPMERVELEFHLHDFPLAMPRADAPIGQITFGFHEDLDEAWAIALDGMLELMQARFDVGRKQALALSSLLVNLHITQVVNGVKGVHAILPHGSLSLGSQHIEALD